MWLSFLLFYLTPVLEKMVMCSNCLLPLICFVVLFGYRRAPEESRSKTDTERDVEVVVPFKKESDSDSEPQLKKVESLKPPEVRRDEPITFKMTDYDVKKWTSKSKDEALSSFKMKDDSWYIDWDDERRPFDTIVIHHSDTDPEATAGYLDNIGRERLYKPRYLAEDPKRGGDNPYVKGLPMHSGHVVNGKERFIGYHHLVYSDGKVTSELSPLVKIKDTWHIDHVGWHAGNWDVNCSSVAICLVGNFSEKEPSEAQLRATAGLIAYYRTFNPKATITGHDEHSKTECPGKTWSMWKRKLQALSGE